MTPTEATDAIRKLADAKREVLAVAAAGTGLNKAGRRFDYVADTTDYPALLEAVEKMKAVIDKLPKYADGSIVHGDSSCWHPVYGAMFVESFTSDPMAGKKGFSEADDVCVWASECYPSEAAALAAREGKP